MPSNKNLRTRLDRIENRLSPRIGPALIEVRLQAMTDTEFERFSELTQRGNEIPLSNEELLECEGIFRAAGARIP